MAERSEPVAVIAYHADPMAELGAGDSGGMNLAVRRLCAGLSERGTATDVFVRASGRESAPEQIAPLSRIVRLRAGPAEAMTTRDARIHVDAFADAVIDHAVRNGTRYRLVHGHYWLGGMVAARLSGAVSIPWAQSFHTLARMKTAAGHPADDERAAAEQRLVTEAERLIAISRSEARALIDLYSAPEEGICVVQLGTDDAITHGDGQALRSALGLGERRVILYAGRLEPLKSAETMLRALASLRDNAEFRDVIGIVAGDNSHNANDERRRLESLAGELGIADAMRFVGSVDHDALGDYYALASVCVVPSRTETFGLVALEAEAAGTPVVAADVDGLRETINHGESGYLVPAGDSAAFAERIGTILRDPALGARLGAGGRRQAARFTWADAARRLDGIYDWLGDPIRVGAPCPD